MEQIDCGSACFFPITTQSLRWRSHMDTKYEKQTPIVQPVESRGLMWHQLVDKCLKKILGWRPSVWQKLQHVCVSSTCMRWQTACMSFAGGMGKNCQTDDSFQRGMQVISFSLTEHLWKHKRNNWIFPHYLHFQNHVQQCTWWHCWKQVNAAFYCTVTWMIELVCRTNNGWHGVSVPTRLTTLMSNSPQTLVKWTTGDHKCQPFQTRGI